MKMLYAKNPKQLDICLRLLYAEDINFIVRVKETEQLKIIYHVLIDVDQERFEELKNKYRIMIS